MSGFDPLVSNGIIYSPVHDIVMSDEPVYFAGPCDSDPARAIQKQQQRDSFVPRQKETGAWKKWLLGATAVAVAIMGVKKFGMKHINKFLKKHPSIETFINSVKKHIPFIKKK